MLFGRINLSGTGINRPETVLWLQQISKSWTPTNFQQWSSDEMLQEVANKTKITGLQIIYFLNVFFSRSLSCILRFAHILLSFFGSDKLLKNSEVYCNAKVKGTLIVKFTQP
jgi:uncharacterized membrane protein